MPSTLSAGTLGVCLVRQPAAAADRQRRAGFVCVSGSCSQCTYRGAHAAWVHLDLIAALTLGVFDSLRFDLQRVFCHQHGVLSCCATDMFSLIIGMQEARGRGNGCYVLGWLSRLIARL